uniref:Uncharacterized protein n=1 Tax=Alexandrium monilatum TaxID=311494 RepID=A0A7S4SEI1_9DINO
MQDSPAAAAAAEASPLAEQGARGLGAPPLCPPLEPQAQASRRRQPAGGSPEGPPMEGPQPSASREASLGTQALGAQTPGRGAELQDPAVQLQPAGFCQQPRQASLRRLISQETVLEAEVPGPMSSERVGFAVPTDGGPRARAVPALPTLLTSKVTAPREQKPSADVKDSNAQLATALSSRGLPASVNSKVCSHWVLEASAAAGKWAIEASRVPRHLALEAARKAGDRAVAASCDAGQLALERGSVLARSAWEASGPLARRSLDAAAASARVGAEAVRCCSRRMDAALNDVLDRLLDHLRRLDEDISDGEGTDAEAEEGTDGKPVHLGHPLGLQGISVPGGMQPGCGPAGHVAAAACLPPHVLQQQQQQQQQAEQLHAWHQQAEQLRRQLLRQHWAQVEQPGGQPFAVAGQYHGPFGQAPPRLASAPAYSPAAQPYAYVQVSRSSPAYSPAAQPFAYVQVSRQRQ